MSNTTTRYERAMKKNLFTAAWGTIAILFKGSFMVVDAGMEIAGGELDIVVANLEAGRMQRDADAKAALAEAKSFFE